MFRLMDYAVSAGLVANEGEFLDKIGNTRTNITRLKRGLQGFSKEQILNACKLTGSSADYVFGFTKVMQLKEVKDPIDVLKRAVAALDKQKSR